MFFAWSYTQHFKILSDTLHSTFWARLLNYKNLLLLSNCKHYTLYVRVSKRAFTKSLNSLEIQGNIKENVFKFGELILQYSTLRKEQNQHFAIYFILLFVFFYFTIFLKSSPAGQQLVFAIVTMNQPIRTRSKIPLNSSYLTIRIKANWNFAIN